MKIYENETVLPLGFILNYRASENKGKYYFTIELNRNDENIVAHCEQITDEKELEPLRILKERLKNAD